MMSINYPGMHRPPTYLPLLCYLLFASELRSQVDLNTRYTTLDTTEILRHHQIIRVLIGEDTIKLRALLRPTKYDLETMRKVKKDSLFQPTVQEEKDFIVFMERSAQNCFSNALELAFRQTWKNGTLPFNADVHLGNKGFEKILESTFKKNKEIQTDRKSKLRTKIPEHALLVFRDKHAKSIHACYYQNERFYSKNGAHTMEMYTTLRDVYNRYPHTQTVIVYQMLQNK